MAKAKFIPGIYNYCDYWCDRCAFTRRCRNFAMGDELRAEAKGKPAAAPPPDRDEKNREFWGDLDVILGDARRQLEEIHAADFDWPEETEPTPEEMEAYEAKSRRERAAVDRHQLMRLAHAQMDAARKWLETAPEAVRQLARQIVDSAHAPVPDHDPAGELDELDEMLEVVRWYHTLLYPKTGRLLHSLLGERLIPDDTDLLGTGKILLVSSDRSIAAWLRLMQIMPEQEDAILRLLAILKRLRRGIEEAVPGARAFIRPGLDE